MLALVCRRPVRVARTAADDGRPAGRDDRRADHEHRAEHRWDTDRRSPGSCPRGRTATRSSRRRPTRRRSRRPTSSSSTACTWRSPRGSSPRPTCATASRSWSSGTSTIPPRRVHLRLLVPGGRGRSEPAPVDGPRLREATTRRSSRDELSKLDPDNAAYYARTTTAFQARIDELDRAGSRGDRDRPAREPEAPDVSRFVPVLRAGVRLDGDRRDPAVGLRRADRHRRSPI